MMNATFTMTKTKNRITVNEKRYTDSNTSILKSSLPLIQNTSGNMLFSSNNYNRSRNNIHFSHGPGRMFLKSGYNLYKI